MPNSITHLFIGALAGGGYTYWANPSDDQLSKISSSIGGILGACLTARIPDVIDPPGKYTHRSIGHSLILNALNLGISIPKLKELIQQYNCLADQAAQNGDFLQAYQWHFLVGLLAGLPIGLSSHLILDAFTPMSLP